MQPHTTLAILFGMLATSNAAPCTSEQRSAGAALATTAASAACTTQVGVPAGSALYKTLLADTSTYYGACQSPCSADLTSYSTKLPRCGEYSANASMLALVNERCTSMKTPTMSGATCTDSDMMLLTGLLSSPPWTNCSSITSATKVKSLYLEQTGTKTACEIPTCAANLIAVQAQMPNCLVQVTNTNSIKAFQTALMCTLPTSTSAATTTLLSGLAMVVAVLLIGA